MILNLLKNNGKYIFKQKRFNFDLSFPRETHYDVIPFNFNEIDKMVTPSQNCSKNSAVIESSTNKLIHKLIKQTQYITYYSISQNNEISRLRSKDSLGKTSNQREYNEEDEILCKSLFKYLPYMNKSSLVTVILRSIPAHYYTKNKYWDILAKKAFRYIFLTGETLSCFDISKILTTISKFKPKELTEFTKKLDQHILMNPNWTIHTCANSLLSLSNLRLYKISSFTYLNDLLSLMLETQNDFHYNNGFNNLINKISRSNLSMCDSLGHIHPVLLSIIKYLRRNVCALKCLHPSTLVEITSILTYMKYDDYFTTNLLGLFIDTIYNFNSYETSKIFYTLLTIKESLSKDAENLVVSLLFRFRDFIMTSDITLFPREVFIILLTKRIFLNNVDQILTSKCLADLGANIHLLKTLPLIGNMLCFNQILNDFSDRLDNHNKEIIKDQFNNLAKIAVSGSLVDENYEENDSMIPIQYKLWHLAALRNLGVYIDYSLKFNEFFENVNNYPRMSAMKNLVLFMANSFGNRELMESYYRNMVLLLCSKLSKLTGYNDVLSEYWNLVECYLVCFDIFKAFEKDLGFRPDFGSTTHSSQLLYIICSMFGERDFNDSLHILDKLAKDSSREIKNEEIIIIKFLMLKYLSQNNEDQARKLFDNFYSPNIELGKIYIEGTDEIANYITRCLCSSCSPISTDILYIKVFYLQHYPKLMVKVLPSIIIGEAFKTKTKYYDIYKIGEWLEREQNWNCLSRFLKNNQINFKKPGIRENEEIKHMYSNWKIEEMEIDYILENNYIGPWLCPYALKNKDINQTVLIFPMDHKLNNNLHIFDKMKREYLSKFGYNFIEIFYE